MSTGGVGDASTVGYVHCLHVTGQGYPVEPEANV
jgi:hypothetical protein